MKLADLLIKWYEGNQRLLPWRETSDPYKIWLSEIILQQTRVAQGLPYYQKFVSRFPTVQVLASADEKDVMRLWQGLGYYSRARNLHRCAKTVVAEWNGKFPATYQELLTLPGVGPYTAAAIASIAFKQPVAVVDGNVFRVIARLFGVEIDILSGEGRKFFAAKANELLSRKHPDLFNQAMMEFGATWCTPRAPRCSDCIFSKSCIAFQQNAVHVYPVKEKKLKVKERHLHYLIVEQGKKIAMKKREDKDIWHSLYDFPLMSDAPVNMHAGANTFGPYKHILTHQRLSILFTWMTKPQQRGTKGLKFYSAKEVAELPKPIVITRFLEERGFI